MRRRDLLIGAASAAVTATAVTAPPASAATAVTAAQDLHPHLSHVMQDFAVDTHGRYYVTQAERSTAGTEDVLISRLDAHGRTLDYMRLLGAGHGIGLDVQTRASRPWISLTWSDASAASGGRARDHVTLAYHPSPAAGWTRAECVSRFGLTVTASQLAPVETLVKLDELRGLAACAQWEGEPGRQVITLRRLTDLRTGTDRPLHRVSLPIAAGTFQGFTTRGRTLYRYLGTGARHGRMSATDPTRIEATDWVTGRTRTRTLPTLGQQHGAWRNGYAEPEGMTVARVSTSHTVLLAGLVTGTGPARRWHTYRIGAL